MKGRTKLERKGRGFGDRLLSLGIMAAVLVIAVLVLIFKRDMDSVVLKDGAYNYFGDVKVEYTGKCRVQYTDKEVTIRDENGTQTLNSKPLYQPDGMALLPFDYAWYAGNDNAYRLSHFSTMAIENNSVVLRDGNLKAEKPGGCLFVAWTLIYSLKIQNFAGTAAVWKSRRFRMLWRDTGIHSSISTMRQERARLSKQGNRSSQLPSRTGMSLIWEQTR